MGYYGMPSADIIKKASNVIARWVL